MNFKKGQGRPPPSPPPALVTCLNEIANDNSKIHNRINKSNQNNTNGFSNLRTTQYDVSRNDKNKNNENVVGKLSSTKRVYVVGDSIVKHVNG